VGNATPAAVVGGALLVLRFTFGAPDQIVRGPIIDRRMINLGCHMADGSRFGLDRHSSDFRW
jgi:hypothetical protein